MTNIQWWLMSSYGSARCSAYARTWDVLGRAEARPWRFFMGYPEIIHFWMGFSWIFSINHPFLSWGTPTYGTPHMLLSFGNRGPDMYDFYDGLSMYVSLNITFTFKKWWVVVNYPVFQSDICTSDSVAEWCEVSSDLQKLFWNFQWWFPLLMINF